MTVAPAFPSNGPLQSRRSCGSMSTALVRCSSSRLPAFGSSVNSAKLDSSQRSQERCLLQNADTHVSEEGGVK